MRECDNYGNEISNNYFRVWSIDEVLEACMKCKSRTPAVLKQPVIDPEDEEREPLGEQLEGDNIVTDDGEELDLSRVRVIPQIYQSD